MALLEYTLGRAMAPSTKEQVPEGTLLAMPVTVTCRSRLLRFGVISETPGVRVQVSLYAGGQAKPDGGVRVANTIADFVDPSGRTVRGLATLPGPILAAGVYWITPRFDKITTLPVAAEGVTRTAVAAFTMPLPASFPPSLGFTKSYPFFIDLREEPE